MEWVQIEVMLTQPSTHPEELFHIWRVCVAGYPGHYMWDVIERVSACTATWEEETRLPCVQWFNLVHTGLRPNKEPKTQYVLKIKKYLDVSGSPRGFKHQQWPTKYCCRIFRQFNQEGLTMTQKRSQQLYNTNRCTMYNVSWRKRSIWIYKKEAHVRDKYVILCSRVQHIRKYWCVADGVERG